MKRLIKIVLRHAPKEFRSCRFTDVAIADDSVTLIGKNVEINLLRNEGIDREVMGYLLKST
jgi:hypothetical protein